MSNFNSFKWAKRPTHNTSMYIRKAEPERTASNTATPYATLGREEEPPIEFVEPESSRVMDAYAEYGRQLNNYMLYGTGLMYRVDTPTEVEEDIPADVLEDEYNKWE